MVARFPAARSGAAAAAAASQASPRAQSRPARAA